MRIWVDADACPGVIREILFLAAERRRLALILVANQALRVPPSLYVSAVQVPKGFDVADLHTKGRAVHSVRPDATVYEALQLMAEKNIGAVLVMEHDRVVGVLSERDYARKVVLQGKSSLNTTVKEIMSDRIYFVRPEQTLDECMALMTE